TMVGNDYGLIFDRINYPICPPYLFADLMNNIGKIRYFR
ncbi:Transposase, IS200/IS605 family, partial [Crocosphaera watsonii WH 0003]